MIGKEIDLSKLVRETDARLAPPETGLYQNINAKLHVFHPKS